MEAAPGETLEVVELLLVRLQAGDIDLVNLGVVARVEPRYDPRAHVNVMCGFVETIVRNKAHVGILNLNTPDKVLCAAFIDKVNAGIMVERAHALELAINGCTPAAVAHHVLKAEPVHIVYGHRVRAARCDCQEVARITELFECKLGGGGDMLLARHARGERAVNVKEQVFAVRHVRSFRCG